MNHFSVEWIKRLCIIKTSKLATITGSFIPNALASSLHPSIVECTTKQIPKKHSIYRFCKNSRTTDSKQKWRWLNCNWIRKSASDSYTYSLQLKIEGWMLNWRLFESLEWCFFECGRIETYHGYDHVSLIHEITKLI